jgi:hypothetical protein
MANRKTFWSFHRGGLGGITRRVELKDTSASGFSAATHLPLLRFHNLVRSSYIHLVFSVAGSEFSILNSIFLSTLAATSDPANQL